MSRRPVILDVDTGNDDAVAIIMAATHPAIELLGCTTVAGNLSLEETTDNTLRVLNAIDRSDIEVHTGLSRPFAPRPYTSGANEVEDVFHESTLPVGTSGLQPFSRHGVEWLIETLRQTTRQVTLISVAPLTNIAAAITVAPDILDAIDEVVLMGGASTFGNRTLAAEFNMFTDAVAANVVLRAGITRLTMAALDATHEVLVSRDDLHRYRALGTRAGDVAAAVTEYYIDGYEASVSPVGAGSSAPPHDALCVAYAIDPKVLDITEAYVEVDTVSPHNYGRTTVDFHGYRGEPANARFAKHADSARFHRILDECLRGTCRAV
ncbi:nucleoside hydrolase [Amycolatopsis echigonensis]|uniref:Nucleoside hydrolase n=1 Tax=Amycolatopsis echigonensis TaxID=2576905 RepID=A0A2N3WND3_9PSEU|nr:nucleoside hydrolase [Amycolatopsis echigonensis]PKV95381.1 purine nucleosidase/ribosylpyrimidine nucleosidase [Amycolatopsis niigatensis]